MTLKKTFFHVQIARYRVINSTLLPIHKTVRWQLHPQRTRNVKVLNSPQPITYLQTVRKTVNQSVVHLHRFLIVNFLLWADEKKNLEAIKSRHAILFLPMRFSITITGSSPDYKSVLRLQDKNPGSFFSVQMEHFQ